MTFIQRCLVTGLMIGLAGGGLFAGGKTESRPSSQALRADAPSWVGSQPNDRDGKSFFVAVGNDPTGNEVAAQDAAALDLIGQINRYLGVSITSESTGTEIATANDYQASIVGLVRQSSEGEVSGLRIADRWVAPQRGVTVYLLGEYLTADLEREKAKRQAIVAENEAAVAVPESRGRESELAGDPWQASRFYLQAARAAAEGKVRNASVKIERNLQNAQRVLNRLELVPTGGPASVLAKQGFEKDFVVQARDSQSGQALAGLDLVATYREYQSNGRFSLARRALKTDAQGLVRLRLPESGAVGNEQLSFSLNLADALQPLAAVDGANRDLVTALMNLAGSKKVVFDFRVLAAGKSVPLALFILEKDENGRTLDGNSALQGAQLRLNAAGFRLVSVDPAAMAQGEKTEADLQQVARSAVTGKAARLAWGVALILSLDDRGKDGVFAKASATVSVTDLESDSVLASATKLVNGRGNDAAQARRDALSRLGQELGDQLARDLP